MPFDCLHRQRFGHEACVAACPTRSSPVFAYYRVERRGAAPAPDPDTLDVIVLDMNHGWPNLGHDAIVHSLQNAVCDLRDALERARLRVRVLSYDVRRAGGTPSPPGEHGGLYLGTGGPGHLDPRRNDGVSPGSQGICEDPSWEPGLFELFDEIRANPEAALIGVCHTFGVMCRWLDVATPVFRGSDKGGKSAGIMENVLTEDALGHPWFGRLAAELPPPHRRIRVLDSRLYDLIPHEEGVLVARDDQPPGDVLRLAYEALGVAGAEGPALTMIEVARDAGGVVPRVLGVNHHPEIVNRARQLGVLRERRDRGDVTPEWYDERVRALTEHLTEPEGENRLDLTSSYTLIGPLRFHLYRLLRRLAGRRGRRLHVEEDSLPLVVSATGDPVPLAALCRTT